MDFDLVDKCGTDFRLSEGSAKVGVTLTSGRVCHWLSEDARRPSPMFGVHRSRLFGCDVPGEDAGELEPDMRDLVRLFEVSDRPQGFASSERHIAAIEAM